MKYIKISTGKYIELDEETNQAKVIVVEELESQKKDLETRIKNSPQPTEEELLEWAKLNFPYVDHSMEQAELDRINNILKEVE